jgi:aryl-alcohol dehydrogenase-like predicted oxidoreductase
LSVDYRAIPGTEMRVSALAFGGWLTLGDRLGEAASLRLLAAAVAGGINFFDLADVYGGGGAERVVGAFVRGQRREQLVISSKVFWPTSERPEDRGLSRAHILASIDRTLARLGTDHVDLYFCHREDPAVTLAETVGAMGELVRAGKVRAWGTSCWRPESLRAAHRVAAELGCAPPRVEQPQYSLLARQVEAGVLPCCRELGMSVVAWSPLAGGVLTGKYVSGIDPASRAGTSRWNDEYLRPAARAAVAGFVTACRERGLEPAVTALAWVMQQAGVASAICGATQEAQLAANLAASRFRFGDEGTAWVERWFPAGRRGWRSLLDRLRPWRRR